MAIQRRRTIPNFLTIFIIALSNSTFIFSFKSHAITLSYRAIVFPFLDRNGASSKEISPVYLPCFFVIRRTSETISKLNDIEGTIEGKFTSGEIEGAINVNRRYPLESGNCISSKVRVSHLPREINEAILGKRIIAPPCFIPPRPRIFFAFASRNIRGEYRDSFLRIRCGRHPCKLNSAFRFSALSSRNDRFGQQPILFTKIIRCPPVFPFSRNFPSSPWTPWTTIYIYIYIESFRDFIRCPDILWKLFYKRDNGSTPFNPARARSKMGFTRGDEVGNRPVECKAGLHTLSSLSKLQRVE